MQERPALGRRQFGDMEFAGTIAPLAGDASCTQAATAHGHHALGGHPFPFAARPEVWCGASHGPKIGQRR